MLDDIEKIPSNLVEGIDLAKNGKISNKSKIVGAVVGVGVSATGLSRTIAKESVKNLPAFNTDIVKTVLDTLGIGFGAKDTINKTSEDESDPNKEKKDDVSTTTDDKKE